MNLASQQQSHACPLADVYGRSVEHFATEEGERLSWALVLFMEPMREDSIMTDVKANQKRNSRGKLPPLVLRAEPEKELELKVKKYPKDKDAKVDLGSDESMDASDPSSATQPGSSDEPAPSSGFPE